MLIEQLDKTIKQKSPRQTRLAHLIYKLVGRTVVDYNMIEDGDRIIVGVSGGKDSLSLLKILADKQRTLPIKYWLLAVHIDLGFHCKHAGVLERYFKENGYNYHIEKFNIWETNKKGEDISCFWCSWNRRKLLFEVADRYNCNKIALGHHKDDVVQTVLLNMFFHGEISTMSPKQEMFSGKFHIIRPLVYIEERLTRDFAKEQKFPLPVCMCPNHITSKRTVMKDILNKLEGICPDVKTNVFRSLKNIKKDYLV